MVQLKNSDQLKAFLKKESKRLGISIANTYNTYFARIFLQKLSEVDRNNNIIIKGSFAQLVHLKNMVRPITDIDIASVKPHHDPLLLIIKAMSDTKGQIKYDLRRKPYKTSTGIYKIPINAKYGSINQAINMDYRENYPFIFKKEIKTVPKIFENDTEYFVALPSIEEILAEKLYVLIKKNTIFDFSTRLKDFYDIYHLHGGEYDLDFFSYCFEQMLRESKYVNINNVSTEFLSREFIKEMEEEWEHNKRKYEFLDDGIDFEGAVYYTRGVLSEQLQKIRQGKNKTYILAMKDKTK